LLEINFGEAMRGKVWLESPPISDDKILAMRNLFQGLLAQQSGFMEVFPFIDYEQIMDLLDVPKNKDVIKGTGGPPEAAMPGADPQTLQAMQQAGVQPGGKPQPLAAVFKALAARQKAVQGFGGEETGPQAPGTPDATPAPLKRFSANRPPLQKQPFQPPKGNGQPFGGLNKQKQNRNQSL